MLSQTKIVVIGAVAGRVISVRRHPGADRLWIATVDIGTAKLIIVHGGTRELAAGDMVPVAPPGARLLTRRRMRARNYRGQRSQGMLCSAAELGWAIAGPDEVAVIRPDIAPGDWLN